MKEGSLERLPEPITTEVASSWRDSSSWSRDREGEGGGGEEGAFNGEGQAGAAAKSRGRGGGEAGPAAAVVGELGVCLVGRWAAGDFLQEREGNTSVRVTGAPHHGVWRCLSPPFPAPQPLAPPLGPHGPGPKHRLVTSGGRRARHHTGPALALWGQPPHPPHRAGEHNAGSAARGTTDGTRPPEARGPPWGGAAAQALSSRTWCGSSVGHSVLYSGLRCLLGSEAQRTDAHTWARGRQRPCSGGARRWAPGRGAWLPAGRGASGSGAAAGTGRPGGTRPCGRSRGTAACASSCTVGKGAAGRGLLRGGR